MTQDVEAVANQTIDVPITARVTGNGVIEQLRGLGSGRILAIGLVLLAFAGFVSYLAVRALEPPLTVLFAGMELDDSRQIVERLEALNVPYQLSRSGDAVMVPDDRVLELRMSLAEDGLPGAGAVGYEIFDDVSAFGTTDFLSNVNLKRALEGELARTISSMRQVRSARVHLVQPRRQLFRQDAAEPSAAIFLTLRSASGLGQRGIAAIRHLVAAAVPGLVAGRVTISDDAGNLLARQLDEGDIGFALSETEAYRAAFEGRLQGKIISLLERSIGPGKVDAQVTVDLDFEEISTTQEIFDPDSQVARSTQSVEEETSIDEREGDRTVGVANNLPTEDGGGGDTATSTEESIRAEETVNYEISRTVRNETRRGGTVRRISVAVQVDGIYVDGADGTAVFEPRGIEELTEIEELVRTAVGLDDERGDTLTVVSRQLFVPPIQSVSEPGMFDFTRAQIMRLVEIAVLAVIAVAVLLFGMRPLLNRLLPENSKESQQVGTRIEVTHDSKPLLVHAPTTAAITVDTSGQPIIVGEPQVAVPEEDRPKAPRVDLEKMVKIGQIEGEIREGLLEQVAEMLDERPDEAVRVIRGWMHE